MTEVTAVAKVQTQEGVACLQTCHEYGHVSLCARVGLNVSILCTKQLAQALTCDILAFVYHFATSVVAFTWIALRIFVGEDTTHGLHYLLAHEVLTGNELNTFHLTLFLAFNNVKNNRIFSHICKKF